MRNVLMRGVKIRGKNIDGAELFVDELQRASKTKSKKPRNTSKREPYPAWVIKDSFSQQWPFSFTIGQIRRWWRLGIISEELLLMQCTSCHKSFVVMREYYEGKISCAYCKKSARPVADQESYLTAMCLHILNRDGKPYVEETY